MPFTCRTVEGASLLQLVEIRLIGAEFVGEIVDSRVKKAEDGVVL